MGGYKRAYFLVGRFIQSLLDLSPKREISYKTPGKLTVNCPLLEQRVSLIHNFPTDRNGRKVYSSDFLCPHAYQGGVVFCKHPDNQNGSCSPFEFLKEQAKTTKISVDEDGNCEEIVFNNPY